MSAFSTRELTALQNAVKALCGRVAGHHHADLALSHDDVLTLFAPPEHHQVLRQVPVIAACSPYYAFRVALPFASVWFASDVTVVVSFRVGGAPCPPRYPELQPNTDPALTEHFLRWVYTRCDIGRDFGRVKAVLDKLDDLCVSAKQVRFLWPAVATLAEVARAEAPGLAEKLVASSPPATIPAITPALREAMQVTAGTIAGANLLSEDVLPTESIEVTLESDLEVNEAFGKVLVLK